MNRFSQCIAAMMLTLVTVDLHAETIFLAGAATSDLTPGEGVSLDGPISKPGPALGVHDRLMSRAIVMKLGETSVLIVINDMCMIDREVFEQAKALVFHKTGIPISHQLMAATHTHAAPRVARISTRDADEAYRKLVARKIADAAIEASEKLAPARIGFGSFDLPNLAACRRSLCKAGTVGTNPFGETGERVKSVAGSRGEVIQPAGAVDPEFSFLSIQHTDGRPIAVLGNFCVHYCGGYERGLVSADYFGVYARRLESALSARWPDNPFVGIMSNATSGDIGSFRKITSPDIGSGPWSRMEYFGNQLADRTIEELGNVNYTVPKQLAVNHSELRLQVRKPDDSRLAWAKSLLADPDQKGAHRWSRIYAQETLHLNQYPSDYNLPLQAIRIGNVGIAAGPCEIFSETGLAIKSASPFEHTMNIELANGYSGYLPSRQQHQWGGYETWAARSSHLEIDAEEKIRTELIRLLHNVK